MANKTLKFYGNGHAPTGQSAAVVVTFNGNTVYTGPVASVAETDDLPLPENQQLLFSFEVDENLYGTYPMSIEVTAGDHVATSYADSNYAVNRHGNPDPLLWYTLNATGLVDYRSNVQLDGVLQSKGALGDVLTGAWLWTIPNGSTLTADVAIVSFADLYPPPL